MVMSPTLLVIPLVIMALDVVLLVVTASLVLLLWLFLKTNG
jgi:hypothetical protein